MKIMLIFMMLIQIQAYTEIPNSALQKLNTFAENMLQKRKQSIGYPINQNTDLKEFYEWYLSSGLYQVNMNNVGNPQKPSPISLNTHEFENEVIQFFAPLYGFSATETWGIVTYSGTDGNAHGVYFGTQYLLQQTHERPLLYVSEEAHYSIKKLADVHHLELKLIKADAMGHMDLQEFEKVLNPKKPALIVLAMGTTFKGAIDDQEQVQEILKRKKVKKSYIHLDAALFGGYLPFTSHHDLVNRQKNYFDSIAVSGHKFFGFDEPMGIFITTHNVLNHINPFKVPYLNDTVPTITCSRSSLATLKFWWKIQKTGFEGFKEQATQILTLADYLKNKLEEMNYPVWKNQLSNTVFFKRPSESLIKKYDLDQDSDARLGGDLAHILVMQHISQSTLDLFVSDLKAEVALSAKPAIQTGK